MKKIVIAPDSFKESMTALEAAMAIEKGFQRIYPDATYVKVPMADGGEGTVQSIVDALAGTIKRLKVVGPLGEPVDAFYGISGDRKVAVIEMAAASGLELISIEKRNPLVTTTYGTGQLMAAALDEGVEKIIIGIGGSATNDGGAGMAQALGAKLLTKDGKDISFGGGSLKSLATIDVSAMHPRLKDVHIDVACDVDNPLLGEQGASAVYGPQKGADQVMVQALDEQLSHYANVIEAKFNKDIRFIPGAGAAGGLGAGLLAFLNVRLDSGVKLVLEATGFLEAVKGADLVITGEGRIDSQTVFGKTPIGVAKAAKTFNVPVVAIAGGLGAGYEAIYDHGIDAAFSLLQGVMELETALKQGDKLLKEAAESIARVIHLTREYGHSKRGS